MLWTAAISLAIACGGSDDEPTGGGGTSGEGGASGAGSEGGTGGTSAGSGGTSGTGGDATPSGDVCANAERAGSLGLRLTGGKTIFDGAIADGITPTSVYEEIASEGSCKLLGPRDQRQGGGAGREQQSERSHAASVARGVKNFPAPLDQEADEPVRGRMVNVRRQHRGFPGDFPVT